MARYLISLSDVNGRYLSTEDEEEAAAAWLWRTLVHLRETWPAGCTFNAPVARFEKVDG